MSHNSRTVKTHIVAIAVVSFTALALVIGVSQYAPNVFAAPVNPPQQVAQPLPSVEVVTLQAQQLRLWSEFSGRLTAVHRVEVKPRVSGTIQQIQFVDGQLVQVGDPLYVIDPRPYQAAVASAEAELASAQSRARLAQLEIDRARGLIEKKVISQSTYDGKTNDSKVAVANIEAAKAALTQARLNLEYAHISAPVAGRISRAEITAGNVVQAGPNAPVLTTIVSYDKLYAEFDVDEQTYVKAVRQASIGEVLPVELTLSSDSGVVYRGSIHDFDNSLDSRSGTIRARAVFPNSDGALVPGMYANVRLGSAKIDAALLISERAIGTDQDRKFVFTVDAAGKVVYREVQLGRSIGGERVVVSGLHVGEQVIVNGLQRVRPDMLVVPVEAQRLVKNQLASR